jgi:hypothetical protein
VARHRPADERAANGSERVHPGDTDMIWLSVLIALLPLAIYGAALKWRNMAEDMLEERDEFLNH